MINIKFITNSGRENMPVPKNQTVRAALEEQGIDYHVAAPSLDAYTLRGAELDKTFAELGATDGSILSVIIKTDNAAKATVTGNALVVTSSAKLEDVKLIAKYRPKTLLMYEGEGDKKTCVFRMCVGTDGNGSISNSGVSLSTRTTAEGMATVTVELDADEAVSIEAIEDMVGPALLKMEKMEATFAAAIEEIKAEQKTVREHITLS